jgi:hypothetical protein
MSTLLDQEDLSSVGREEAAVVRIDTVGQAAAGGLLLSIAIVELVLGFWAAGWHHRAVALSVAGLGLSVLASAVVDIATVLRSPDGAPGSPRIDAPPERSAR